MKQFSLKIWLLLSILFPLSTFGQSEDFFSFIKKFSQDTTFQNSRIIFPLEVITWDFEKDCETVIKAEINDSLFFPVINYNSKCSDGYFFIYPNIPLEGKEMILDIKGISDSSEKFWFILIDNKWYLNRYRNFDYGY